MTKKSENYNKSKKCEYCGNIFYKRYKDTNEQWNNRKYCSPQCNGKRRIGKPFPHTNDWNNNVLIACKNSDKYGKQGGWKQSQETIEKKRLSLLGHILKDETKNKIREKAILRGALVGDKNPNWRGGINKNPYPKEWKKTLKESIRQRDNYQCKICDKKQVDKSLPVHHIDYNKDNLDPNNLITLCPSCHTKTTFNRDYWIKYFKGDT